MPNGLLPAVAAILLFGLLSGTFALIRGNSEKALRARLRALSAAQAPSTASLPSIRVGGSPPGGLSLRIARLVSFNPEIPQSQVLAWPLVAMLCLGVGAAGAFGAGRIVEWPLAAPVGLVAAVATARMAFGWQNAQYTAQVFLQLPDALGLMSRAIRAGLPLAEALRGISRDMQSPTREEFARVVGDVAIGRPIEVALTRLQERTGVREYGFLAVTLSLQSQTGGSLAETLENLAGLVRQRVQLAKRARALAGEAKAQAGVLIILPFVGGAAMSFIQPFYIATFIEDPMGQRMGIGALCLMLCGVLTMRWLIRRAGQD